MKGGYWFALNQPLKAWMPESSLQGRIYGVLMWANQLAARAE
uniref:Uncharacterized protein n=1 Tax=Rheinheimera sp. BAL341 TaxID=1708203 RepID=A0A486XHM8_9GAMM